MRGLSYHPCFLILRIGFDPRASRSRPLGGAKRSRRANGMVTMPKREIVRRLATAFKNRRLEIANGLPPAGARTGKLQAFQVRLTAKDREPYAARSGEHDDPVLAVETAVWFRRGCRLLAWATRGAPRAPGACTHIARLGWYRILPRPCLLPTLSRHSNSGNGGAAPRSLGPGVGRSSRSRQDRTGRRIDGGENPPRNLPPTRLITARRAA